MLLKLPNTRVGFNFTGPSIDNRSRGGNFGGMIMGDQRGVFNLDIIFENSKTYRLDEIAEVYKKETESIDRQSSLKTIIVP